MKLYHGTSARNLNSILQDAIRPRGSKKGNWSHSIESDPNAVYLTNSYPFHFATNAVKKGDKIVVFEIDCDPLLPWRFAPDEDFLEQATRNAEQWKHVTGNFIQRTRWFRKRALSEFQHLWDKSVEYMGTCCYHGPIPAKAITRYAVLSPTTPICFLSDPTITTMNYRILGGYYRDLVRKLFGDEVINDEPCISDGYRAQLLRCPRDGIEVVVLNHASLGLTIAELE